MFRRPPFEITTKILDYVQNISLLLGAIKQNSFKTNSNIKLRKSNCIKTIKSSMAIEGNSISLEQVSAILHGQQVIAPKKDIVEVKNAIATYEAFDQLDPFKINDLLKAHNLMMADLTESPGHFRQNGVGVFKENLIVHLAPHPSKVSGLMTDLFAFLKFSEDSLLIKSCVFHYEFEFIHPFSDGNGRIGRLWQQLILSKLHPAFKLLCVEELLEKYQTEYYEALHKSDLAGSSESFIEFMLGIIFESLKNLRSVIKINSADNFESRLSYARNFLNHFKRADYMQLIQEISTATASRDLINGVKNGILEKEDFGNQTKYFFRETTSSPEK